jgi:hypothetical protein
VFSLLAWLGVVMINFGCWLDLIEGYLENWYGTFLGTPVKVFLEKTGMWAGDLSGWHHIITWRLSWNKKITRRGKVILSLTLSLPALVPYLAAVTCGHETPGFSVFEHGRASKGVRVRELGVLSLWSGNETVYCLSMWGFLDRAATDVPDSPPAGIFCPVPLL